MLRYYHPAQMMNRKGYTLDQTILIVVIIAILITMIIVTLGWQLINRTSGTKLSSQLSQVEDAITQFYGMVRVFPHQAFATAPTTATTGNVFVMTGSVPAGATLLPSINVANLTNLLGKFDTAGSAVQNKYGGNISMVNGTVTAWTGSASTGQYLIVEFTNVPLADAQEADRVVDGDVATTAAGNIGRLVLSPNATTCLPNAGSSVAVPSALPTTSPVRVCYVASPIN
jgi:hypothetical protein